MSEITTSEVMYGTAGVVNGKLQLSQGITRDLSHGGIGGQFTEIPVIDLSPMTNPSSSPVDKTKLVADIRAACSRVGFFVIKNHGIEWKIVDDAFDGLKEFFDLPMEKKMEVHQSMSDSYQEYAPRLRPTVEAYRAACLKLMRQLVRVVAIGIGEKEDFFEKKITYPIAGIRALYYPPQEAPGEEETGLGAHTDVQLMTMIAQKPFDVQALQVLNSNGEWISPSLEPETFVVNLGDMMARLTNDTFQSTVHRVCNTDTRGRYSLPFFFGLSNDELTTTLPQFVTPENPLRDGYEKGLTGYEHYNVRLQRAHHKHPSAVNKISPALPPGMTKVDGVLVEGM